MKPTTKEINDRLRECFNYLPKQSKLVREWLRSGGVYVVRRAPTFYGEICVGNVVAPDNLNSSTELLKEYGGCRQPSPQ